MCTLPTDLKPEAGPPCIVVGQYDECNLHCRFCREKQTVISEEVEARLLEGIQEALDMRQAEARLLCGNGEIFHLLKVRPRLRDVLYNLPNLGEPKVWISAVSNGTLLHQHIPFVLDRFLSLTVSLDSLDEGFHRYLRGTSSAKIQDSLRCLAAAKAQNGTGHPTISLTAVLMNGNLAEMERMVDFALDVGASILQFSPLRPGRDEEFYNEQRIEPDTDEHRRVLDALQQLQPRTAALGLKLHGFRMGFVGQAAGACTPTRRDVHCTNPWERVYIQRNGTLTICCGLPKSIGNLLESSFRECWHSDMAVAIRQDLLAHNYTWCNFSVCQNPDLHAVAP